MADVRPRLILGSGSPRRRELLAQIGHVPHAVRAPDIDETPRKGESPHAYCRRIAREKAAAAEIGPGEVLLAADTTVALGRRILGKAGDAAEAEAFLRALSGRRHNVITAVVVRRDGRTWERIVTSVVKVKRLSEDEIRDYLASDEWQGKAGGYGIQGRFGAFVPWMAGSFSAIVGLPVAETAALLASAGLRAEGSGP